MRKIKVKIKGLVSISDILNDAEINTLAAGCDKYAYIGIRIQETPEQIGSTLTHVSHVWDDEDDTGELLPGVCALDYSEMLNLPPLEKEFGGYPGEYVLILGSQHATAGGDPAEIIMRHPVVLECVETKQG